MKILYAAGNRIGSLYQLKRFISSIDKSCVLKIAAFKRSMGNLNVDYNLDSLLNFTNPNGPISFNGNYSYFYNEIKRLDPDLIVSDFEIYSSIVAMELNIKLWQISPINLYYALDKDTKAAFGIHGRYAFLLDADRKRTSYINYMLNNSNKKLVLSHLCDSKRKPQLLNGFEYVRPNFILGSGGDKADCLTVLAEANKNINNKYKSSIVFSDTDYEIFKNKSFNINNYDAYSKYLAACNYVVSDGTATFLADAFYNQKYCFSYPRYNDIESIICSFANEHFKLGKIGPGEPTDVEILIDDKIKFISQHLKEL